MRAVFDSNILIDYLNKREEAREEIEKFEFKIISVISYIEVLVGITDEGDAVIVKNFLSSFEVANVDKTIANSAIALRQKYKLKIPDSIILATAKAKSALLVTRDIKDFPESLPIIRVPYKIK